MFYYNIRVWLRLHSYVGGVLSRKFVLNLTISVCLHVEGGWGRYAHEKKKKLYQRF